MEAVNIGHQLKSKKEVEDIFTRSIGKAASKSTDTKVNSYDNEYDVNNPFRGLAVIISNGNFKNSVPRPYCDDELKRMAQTFGSSILNFTIVTFKDLTVHQMEWVFDTAADQKEFHQKSDCFVCVIASHGNEKSRQLEDNSGEVYFRDHCLYGVDDLTLTTTSIIERFSNLDELQNKPKLFFIQACRSKIVAQTEEKVDQGYEVGVKDTSLMTEQLGPQSNNSEGTDKEHTDVIEGKGIMESFKEFLFGKSENKPKDIIRILYPPCEDDCLIVYSSTSEKSSYGRDKVGGWMLYSLHFTMNQHIERIRTKQQTRIDIISLLTDMSRFVSETFETRLPKNTEYPKRKATVVFEHCLHKDFYLP